MKYGSYVRNTNPVPVSGKVPSDVGNWGGLLQILVSMKSDYSPTMGSRLNQSQPALLIYFAYYQDVIFTSLKNFQIYYLLTTKTPGRFSFNTSLKLRGQKS